MIQSPTLCYSGLSEFQFALPSGAGSNIFLIFLCWSSLPSSKLVCRNSLGIVAIIMIIQDIDGGFSRYPVIQ
jgi:hypothetical protein